VNKEELDLEIEHYTLLTALADAKQNADTDKESLTNAKRALYEFRVNWRSVRAAFTQAGVSKAPEDGVADVYTVDAVAPVTNLRGDN